MIDIIVCSIIYFICDKMEKLFGWGDYREKSEYRMKEVNEDVIFFTDKSDMDEAFRL